MSDSVLTIYNPTTQVQNAAEAAAAPRLTSLDGKVIGVIWNNKQPGDVLLKQMQEKLRKQYGAVIGPFLTKPWLGNIAPDAILDELSSCDAVVSGIGDCGSCMSANVLDAITMARRGVPATAVGTLRLAETTGRGMARFHGLPNFPIAIIRSRPVRLEGVTDTIERAAVTDEFLPQVVAALVA